MLKEKKAQTNVIAIIIAIALGLIIIVFLIWGFTTNWRMFTGTTEIYVGDLKVVAMDACRYQCNAELKTQFCDVKKPIGGGEKKTCVELGMDCARFSCPIETSPEEPVAEPEVEPEVEVEEDLEEEAEAELGEEAETQEQS